LFKQQECYKWYEKPSEVLDQSWVSATTSSVSGLL